jgi:nitrite reductase/ring-hydroxylating ferredoxin subunit
MKVRIILCCMLLLVVSCKKKSKNHPVPNIPFDLTINLSLPSYSDLNGVGGWAYVAGGARGIVVYRKSYDEFMAFDRQSPSDGGADCATPLTPNTDNFLQLDDACSGAKFSLYDGSIISGPSEYGLRQYQTAWNGGNVLRIYN